MSNAHAAARFRTVELLTRPGTRPGTVIAILVLESPLRVARARVDAVAGPIPRGALRPVLSALEGAQLDETALRSAADAVRAAYRRRGFFEVEVWPKVLERGDTAGSEVLFGVDPGPRARIVEVELEPLAAVGDLDLAALQDALRTRLGRTYSHERIDEDRDRLARALRRVDRPLARVETPLERYSFETAELVVVFPFDPGPRVEVVVEGMERRALERHDLLPLRAGADLDEASVEQACARIVDFLHERGYARASARCGLTGDATVRRLEVDVDRGPRVEVTDVVLRGNELLDDDVLLPLLDTGAGSWTAPGSGKLVPRILDADLATLRSYYTLQGFAEVRVGPTRIEYHGATGGDPAPEEIRATLEIPIVEGPRRRVVDLSLSGVRVLEPADLRAALPLRAGGPFHEILLDDALDVVRTLYEEEGHASVRVEPSLDWSPDGTLVDLSLRVDEGTPRRVDRVLLRGHHRTRAALLERVADLEPGERISRRRLLQAERDLYRLGLFSRVDVELVPTASPRATARDILIDLEEGRRWRIAYGLSYHSDDGIGGLFGITRANLFGRGARLQLDLRGSANDQRARLVYDQPVFGPLRLPITASLFARNDDRDSFDVRELGSQIQITKDFDRLRLGLAYDYRLVEFSQEPFDPTELEREDQAVEIASLTQSLILDRRDDPIDPRLGFSTNAQIQFAFPLLDADASFLKLFAQQTQYRDLGPFGTLAASLRVGLIEPINDSVPVDPIVPPGLASAEVPISERFFAGGRTTHRAYERDALGLAGSSLLETPDGRVLELGGNGLALLNIDWRFPLAGDLGGVVFLDVGNVWADWRDATARSLRPGAGLGLRYASPVGPVRLEVGWKLDPGPLDATTPVLFLSFGNPF